MRRQGLRSEILDAIRVAKMRKELRRSYYGYLNVLVAILFFVLGSNSLAVTVAESVTLNGGGGVTTWIWANANAPAAKEPKSQVMLEPVWLQVP